MSSNGKTKVKTEHLTPTVVFLNPEQIDFLNGLNKAYFEKCGYHLSRNRILTELVNCLMGANIDFSELDPDKENICQFIAKKVKDAYKDCI